MDISLDDASNQLPGLVQVGQGDSGPGDIETRNCPPVMQIKEDVHKSRGIPSIILSECRRKLTNSIQVIETDLRRAL
jgi:hypothetical protein